MLLNWINEFISNKYKYSREREWILKVQKTKRGENNLNEFHPPSRKNKINIGKLNLDGYFQLLRLKENRTDVMARRILRPSRVNSCTKPEFGIKKSIQVSLFVTTRLLRNLSLSSSWMNLEQLFAESENNCNGTTPRLYSSRERRKSKNHEWEIHRRMFLKWHFQQCTHTLYKQRNNKQTIRLPLFSIVCSHITHLLPVSGAYVLLLH